MRKRVRLREVTHEERYGHTAGAVATAAVWSVERAWRVRCESSR